MTARGVSVSGFSWCWFGFGLADWLRLDLPVVVVEGHCAPRPHTPLGAAGSGLGRRSTSLLATQRWK